MRARTPALCQRAELLRATRGAVAGARPRECGETKNNHKPYAPKTLTVSTELCDARSARILQRSHFPPRGAGVRGAGGRSHRDRQGRGVDLWQELQGRVPSRPRAPRRRHPQVRRADDGRAHARSEASPRLGAIAPRVDCRAVVNALLNVSLIQCTHYE
jgi:hypothetical protein